MNKNKKFTQNFQYIAFCTASNKEVAMFKRILKEVLYFVHIVHNISTVLQSGFGDKKNCRLWCVL